MKSFLSKYFLLILIFTSTSFLSNSQTITWSKTTGPYGGTVGDLIVHPTNFTVYSLTGSNNNGGSLYRSSDNGNTWVEQKPVVFSNDLGYIRDIEMLTDGTILAAAPSNLYKSIDDGATWTKINTGTSSSSNGFDQSMKVAKNYSTGTLYIAGYDYSGSSYKMFRSTNAGSTWTKSLTNNNYYTQIVTMANGDVYALASAQLLRSTDDGINFSAATATPDASNIVSLAAKSDGSQLAVVTANSNIYTLANGSTTWSAAVVETGIADPTYSTNALLAFSPDKTTMFLLDNQNNKFYSRTSGNWSSLNTTFVTTGGENGICFAAKDNSNLYVGTNDIGVYKSINGGSGWIEVNTGIESSNFNNMVVADDGSIINAGQRAFRSTDNGTSWTKISNVASYGYFVFKASTGSPKPIVLLGQSGQPSFKSTNSGSSWSATTATPANASNFISIDGTKIYGYGNGQFFYTSDQGTTWSAALTITGTGWPVSPSIQYISMDQNSVIYSYLWDGSSYKFFKIVPNSTTTPTTGTATQISLATIGVTGVNAIGYSNNKVFVSGYGSSTNVLSSTSNAGSTWTPTTTSFSAYRIDSDPVYNYLFLTQSNNNSYTVNLSRDGGSTFTASTLGASSNKTYVYGYALNSSGVAFAGVSNSSVFTTTNTIVIPAAPTSLVNSGAATDRVNLRWIDNATNETRFVIEKFNGTSYDSISYRSSNYTTGAKVYREITGLQPNTSYTFRVYAKNSAGSSAPVSITLSTLASCASTIPDNRSWSGTVTPSPGAVATLTNISIKSKGSGQYSITDVVNGTISGQSTTIPGVFVESCNSTYLISDYPTESNGNGTWTSGTSTLVLKWITSNGVNTETTGTVSLVVNVTDPVPAPPSNTTAYVYNNTGIEISWIGSAFETQYVVDRSKVSDFSVIDRTFNVNYPSTSVVDNTGLVNSTTYYYRVWTKNTAGTSATPSNTATILFTKPYFTLSGTTVESTNSYSTTGAIWGDFNNDGFDDLIMPQLTLFTGITTVPLAFKNDGAGNFVSISPTGITPSSDLVGAAADYDNDGKLDLFLTATGSQNFLYKGNGDFTFSLVVSTPVSENYSGVNAFELGASWADYNKDGLVDLYVLPNDHTKNGKLFTQGPVGTFTKETTGALIPILADAGEPIWADYDNDGDQDVFITDQNSLAVNQLYKNNGDATFTRVTGAPFDTDADQRSFTAAWGDYNNDTFLDLFIGAQPNNLLYKNNGNGTFSKQSFPTTVTETSNKPFGAAWGDVNNDGYLDLVVSNQTGENQFYLNNSGTAFTKVNNEKLNDSKSINFGAAFSDYNNDGYLDLAVSVIDPNFQAATGPTQKNQLFKNNFASGNWAEIKLVGITSNKMALGARITLVSGGKTQIREVTSIASFCGQPSQKAHFGIGANASITSIQIKWPSGIVQTYANPPINQILTIIEDNQGPAIAVQSPATSSSSVATNTKVDITLNESALAVAGKKLIITGVGDAAPFASLDVTTATKTGNTYSFALPSKLALNKQYSVTLDAGAFTDVYGNASLALSSGWTFTTSAGPTVSSLTPAHNSSSISAATTLAVQFNVPVTAVASKNILLYDKSNLTTPVATLSATAGVITTNTVTFTLPTKLSRQTVYVASIDAGAFIDASSNDFAGLATTAWEFTTDPGPSITTFLPANNATNVAIDASIEITFNKSVTAVAGKNIKIMDGASVVLDVPVSTTGSLTGGGKYKLIPTTNLPYLKTLSVLIDAGAFIDANQNDFAGLTASQYSFTTVEAPDVTAPVFVAFVPPTSVNKGFGTSTPSIEVTDAKGVTSVKVFIRSISGSTFTEQAGTFNNTTTKWDFTLAETSFDAIGAEYYIEARDAANNMGRSPAGTTYHQTYLKYTADLQIPDAVVGVGGKKADWKVIAIPFDLANGGIATVFDELSSKTNQVDYRIISYKDATAWAEYPSSDLSVFTRGKGYFINLKVQIPLTIGANLVPPANTRNDLFKISLKKGWNMIGNPYATPISWVDVATLNGLTGTAAQLKQYTNGSYVINNALPAYVGGFVFVDADTQVSIPFLGQTTPGGRVQEEIFSSEDWMLPMTISAGQTTNTFAGIGMHSKASTTFDRFDEVNPPHFFDYVDMNFPHPEHFEKNFSRDVVPTQSEYTWEFVVETNLKGNTEIVWDNSYFRSSAKSIFLLDMTTKNVVDMKQEARYTFSATGNNKFVVVYGSANFADKFLEEERLSITALYPVPSQSSVTIGFNVPQAKTPTDVQVQVINMLGQLVGVIHKGELKSGYHEVVWSGADQSGNRVSSGVYVVSVSSATGTDKKQLIMK